MLTIFFHIAFWLVLSVWFFRTQYVKPCFWLVVASILLKIFTTIAFVYLHQKLYPQYTPDYTLIFADACRLSDLIHQNTLQYLKILLFVPEDTETWHLASQDRAFFAVKCYSFLVWITGKNFWLSMFYASGAVLAVLWWLTQILIFLFPNYRKFVIVSFIFLPSLTFWASATSKESLLMIFLAILSVLFLKNIYQRFIWWQAIVFLIVFYWLLLLKYYYAFGFLVGVGLYVFLLLVEKLKVIQKILCVFGVFVVFLGLTFLHPNLQINNFAEALYDNYVLILQASPEGSALDLGLQPTWQSLLLHSPLGLWIGLFAPLPHQISKWQMLPIALENFFVLILFGLVLWEAIKSTIQNSNWGDASDNKNKYLLISLLVYIFIMATFLGLSSPNFGALSRYRVGFSPFLIYILLVFFQNIRQKNKPQKH
ncbi:MAG: hypothetical protein ACK40K_00295 [Raineya sp.]